MSGIAVCILVIRESKELLFHYFTASKAVCTISDTNIYIDTIVKNNKNTYIYIKYSKS